MFFSHFFFVFFLAFHRAGMERNVAAHRYRYRKQHRRLHSLEFVTFKLIHNEWNTECPHDCISHAEHSWGAVLGCRDGDSDRPKTSLHPTPPHPPTPFNYTLPTERWLENSTICSVEHAANSSSKTPERSRWFSTCMYFSFDLLIVRHTRAAPRSALDVQPICSA